MNRPMFYKLVDDEPVACSIEEWSEWRRANPASPAVDLTTVPSAELVQVSTVFLGIEHAVEGPPHIYETRVFGGKLNGKQERYSTRAEALEGHARMVAACATAEREA